MQEKNLKILIVIPARKNSKRLPNKNLLKVNKKSLIQRTIDIAKQITDKENIIISTDSSKIQKIAKQNQINVPWLRPKKLSSDKASSENVVLHALNWYEKNFKKVNCLLLSQPTSPFRKKNSILKGLNLFEKNKKFSIISIGKVNNTNSHKFFFMKEKNKLMNIFNQKNNFYRPNGSFYIIKPSILRSQKTFYIKKLKGFILKSQKENIDIDNIYDLKIARSIKE